ncbi:MAG: alanine racemase [Actinomycetota bacterium]|nr:alanine racemase [Actinomycetota bacterium]
MAEAVSPRAIARVNLAAIERNVVRLRAELEPGTALCAVVKADGYGHGAPPSARAALAGGAGMLAVATAAEAAQLRADGIGAPILVMGAISAQELPVALAAGAELVVWSAPFVAALARLTALPSGGAAAPTRVHVKLDTGMGRLGTRQESEALEVAAQVLGGAPALALAGAMTHFATAGEDPEFLARQIASFDSFVATVRARHPRIVAHAANSAATMCEPASHFDLVRCGIAIYGCDPMNEDPEPRGLEPALELTSYLAAVKLARVGESAGYGRRFVAQRETWIATLPIGYADGIRRALSERCDVLTAGRRHPLVGAVSMDNITVDLGEQIDARPGDRATIIGRDGAQRQLAEDLARRIGTINYEIVCGISHRVPRVYHRDGEPAPASEPARDEEPAPAREPA